MRGSVPETSIAATLQPPMGFSYFLNERQWEERNAADGLPVVSIGTCVHFGISFPPIAA
jgi:hypothetical protein